MAKEKTKLSPLRLFTANGCTYDTYIHNTYTQNIRKIHANNTGIQYMHTMHTGRPKKKCAYEHTQCVLHQIKSASLYLHKHDSQLKHQELFYIFSHCRQ